MALSFSQSSFATGEINPLATGRNDILAYQMGLSYAENVMVLPQGSIIKRWGLKDLHYSFVGNFAPSSLQAVNTIGFDFGDGSSYLIVVLYLTNSYNLEFFIYKNDINISVLSASFTTLNIDIEVLQADKGLSRLNHTQYGDSLILCHPSFSPLELSRNLNDDNIEFWNVSSLKILNMPQHKFDGVNSQNVWSPEKGYPEACCFHESRLFFASTYSLPQTVWGSKSGVYNDFGVSSLLKDTDGLSATLLSGSLNKIQHIYSLDRLILFTTGGPWFLEKSPITPQNFGSFIRHSEYGASVLNPAFIEDGIVFHQLNSNNLRLFSWSSKLEDFASKSLSYLGGHLIKKPVSMAAVQNLGGGFGDYVFMVNEDGSLAVCNFDLQTTALSWVRWTSPFNFLKVQVADNQVYFIMKSPHNQKIVLVRLDQNMVFDLQNSLEYDGQTLVGKGINNPGYFDNTQLQAKIGQLILKNPNVDNSKHPQKAGFLTLDSKLIANLSAFHNIKKFRVDFGLPITLKIKTLPPSQIIKNNNSVLDDLCLVECKLFLQNSSNYEIWLSEDEKNYFYIKKTDLDDEFFTKAILQNKPAKNFKGLFSPELKGVLIDENVKTQMLKNHYGPLDTIAPNPYSGWQKHYLIGPMKNKTLTIKQDLPFAFKLLGVVKIFS